MSSWSLGSAPVLLRTTGGACVGNRWALGGQQIKAGSKILDYMQLKSAVDTDWSDGSYEMEIGGQIDVEGLEGMA